jgi:uncharacterized protein YodC (DUF2158 family)
MELKPADVVTLKSGGHPLTVVEVNEDNISCLWMGGEGDLFRENEAEDETDGDEDEDEAEDDEDEDDEDEPKKKKRA